MPTSPPPDDVAEKNVELSLLEKQEEAFFSEEPYRAFVAGVGGGKTHAGSRWAILRALEFPDGFHVATINTYPQGRDVVVPALVEAAEEWGLRHEFRKGDADFHLLDFGATIHVRSTERFETLRGTEIDSWWGDEVRDAKKRALDVLWGRMRGRKSSRPEVLWTTTPNGFDSIHDRFVRRRVTGRHRLVQATSAENVFLAEEYLSMLAEQYDELYAQQELEGLFLNVMGRHAYRGFERKTHEAADLKLEPEWPVLLCCDFNIDPHVWLVCQDIGPQINILEEIITRGLDVATQVEKFAQWRIKNRHDGPFTVYGDASGGNRSGQTGKSWYDLMTEEFSRHGLAPSTIDVPAANPPVGNRVLSVCSSLSGKGAIGTRVHPRCQMSILDFEQCVWKDSGDLDKSDPERTHASDAFGYMMHRRHPIDAFVRDNRALRDHFGSN